MVIHGICICLKNDDHEIRYHKFGKEDVKSYTTSKSDKRYNKF